MAIRSRTGRVVAAVAVTLASVVVAGAGAGAAPTGAAGSDRCLIGLTHHIFLDRPATETEKQDWTTRFATGTPRSALPSALAGSDEWLTVVVTDLYRQALDRDPDTDGLAHWIGELRRGATVNRIASLIYGSPEYLARAGGTTDAFVVDLYARILRRTASADDTAYWTAQVDTRGRGRVAALFFASRESRASRVTDLYQRILGRPPDPAGRTYWIDQLARVNDVRLAVLLAASPELRTRAPAACWGGTTKLTPTGDDESRAPAISADGRHVAFESSATNLTGDRDNGSTDVFLHDTLTGSTTNLTSAGDDRSSSPAISADGRRIAFTSSATNLTDGPSLGRRNVFLHDTLAGTTRNLTASADSDATLPAISADGRHVAYQANDLSGGPHGARHVFLHDTLTGATTNLTAGTLVNASNPTLSADGRHVAFTASSARPTDDTAGDVADVVVHDRLTGTTTNLTPGADNDSYLPVLSADGDHVAFDSFATNVTDDPDNHVPDVFIHDRRTGTTTNLTATGNDFSGVPVISADGGATAFASYATNLTDDPDNGHADVFVHDTASGGATNLTVGGDADSWPGGISADGRVVAFASNAANLTRHPHNGTTNVYVTTYLG